MDADLEKLNDQMKEEVNLIKEKYNTLKKEVKKKYKIEKPPSKPTRISIPKSVKDIVWDQNIGKEAGIGKCFCCNEEINSKKFDCGHIVSVAEGGTNNVDNYLKLLYLKHFQMSDIDIVHIYRTHFTFCKT